MHHIYTARDAGRKLINDYLDGVTLDALVAPNEGYDYVI